MNYIRKLLLLVFIGTSLSSTLNAQCNQIQTVAVCDIQNIDFDTDGTPDGIINLYTETGTTLADGVWSTAVNNAIALDQATGNLSTWELRNASLENDDYVFTLTNDTACGTGPILSVNLVVGAYSGVALPPDDDDINYYICDSDSLDLNTVLISNAVIPIAHINGVWSLVSNPGGGALMGSTFSGEVDYQPGLPRVDQNVYELVYTVSGNSLCTPISETTVKISVVRQVFSGTPSIVGICEGSIWNGDYDDDIDVRDDEYLVDEDIEGYWNEELDGDVSNLTINIKELYDELTDNGNNPRFGCESYNFTYTVEKRSVVCVDMSSTVVFTIYEELRPFQQFDFPELCPGKIEEPPVIVKLYDLIEFTEGFEYKDSTYTHWEFISGPSDLNLVVKHQVDPLNPIDLTCSPDPALTIPDVGPPYYDPEAPVNISGARPGEYRFKYIVCPGINGCGGFCPRLETEVLLVILPEDHAGEDTDGLNFCETDDPIDLRSLLNTNGIDTVVTTGVWTDEDGNEVENTFVIPEIEETQVFTFTYATEHPVSGCLDDATLTFTLYKEANAGAGTGTATRVCSDNLTVTLFDLLEDNPDTTGIWTGPFGYMSPDHLGVFDASDDTLPILGPGDYIYTVLGNAGCTSQDQAIVTIDISEPIEIGNDRNETFCKLDGRVNLYSLLDSDTVRTGVFEDTDNTEALSSDGVLEFETLTNGIYNFRYVVANTLPCDESTLNVAVQIVDLPEPNVPNQEFCILDAKHLDDIEVDVLNYNWYSTLESDMPIIDNPILFDNQIYYIATVDADNCESERVQVSIDILNMGERFSNGELCTLDFQDGVSPDGNNLNDTFDLFIENEFNIPVAFPDFELKIFNRYGTEVYNGNVNTEEFRGESNVSLRLGDDLPSGTYFYIFTPNFENNQPIQGSFYLSR